MLLTLEIDNIHCRFNQKPDEELKTLLKEILTYEELVYFQGKHNAVTRCLYNIPKRIFPTGMATLVINCLKKKGYKLNYIDKRAKPEIEPLKLEGVTLRDYQQEVVDTALTKKRGVIQVATGGGKTIIASSIIAELNIPTIFIVHTKDLLIQAYDTFSKVLQKPIGVIGNGKCNVEKFNVGMIQTIARAMDIDYEPLDEYDKYKDKTQIKKHEINELLQKTGLVIVDEAHHLSSKTYVSFMKNLPNAYYRFGLSATPFRNDGKDKLLKAYAGKLLCSISASYLISRGFLSKPTIFMINPASHKRFIYNKDGYQKVYKEYVVQNDRRNRVIQQYAKYLYDKGYRILILVNQINHGNEIMKLLNEVIDGQKEFVTSEVSSQKREELFNKMREGELRVVMGTSLCDEGLDIPIVDALILAGAGKSVVRIPQRIGRTLRLHPDKKQPVIIDFYDRVKFLCGQSKKRLEIYASEPEFIVKEKF